MSKPTRPVNLWCSYFFVLAATLQLCSWEPLCAQQRDPAVEIYGLMGTYYFGNSQNVLKNREWKPQVGVGALFPVGSKWALMIDGVTSRLEVNEGPHGPYTDHSFSEFYRVNPGVQNNDLTTQRLIAILPSCFPRFAAVWCKSFVFSFLPIRKVLILPLAEGVSPPLPVGFLLFSVSYPQASRSYYLFFNYLYMCRFSAKKLDSMCRFSAKGRAFNV